MRRAFKWIRLPLGAYQFVNLTAEDLGDQFTNSGKAPRTVVLSLSTAMDEQFVQKTVTALLTEEAQRHLIAVLEANLDDDKNRARDLIHESHSQYGSIEQ